MQLVNFSDIRTASNTLYNYDDIANATGFTVNYLFATRDSTGNEFQIAEQQLYSNPIHIGGVGSPQGHDPVVTTTTFRSSPLNSGRVMRGRVYFDFYHDVSSSGGAGSSHSSSVTVKLYHYDGSSATQIGSTWTAETIQTAIATNETVGQIECGYIDVDDDDTNFFAVGHQIQVVVASTLTQSGGNSTGSDDVYFDPVDRIAPPQSRITFRMVFPWKLHI